MLFVILFTEFTQPDTSDQCFLCLQSAFPHKANITITSVTHKLHVIGYNRPQVPKNSTLRKPTSLVVTLLQVVQPLVSLNAGLLMNKMFILSINNFLNLLNWIFSCD